MSLAQVQILEKENDTLLAEISGLKTENHTLKERNQHLHEEYEQLLHLLKVANRNQYGVRSEKYIDPENGEQLSLLDTVETATVAENEETQTETISYERKKRSRKDQNANLPRREIIISVKEEDRVCSCGTDKKHVRYETKEMIHYQPAVFEILLEKREVLACPKKCEGSIVTADAPQQALPKVTATEELLSYIAVSKTLDRQPLYHLEKQFESRYQVAIARNTMARWMIELATVFQPLINLLKDTLISYDIAGFDATTLQVLKEPDRKATTKSYAYCFRGGPPGKDVVLYEYVAEKHKEFLADWFLGFKGKLQVDADPWFKDLPLEGLITLSKCNAHARRKFEQIMKVAKRPGLAKQAVLRYQAIYKVEKEAKRLGLSAEERHQLRQEKIKPLMDDFKLWLDEHEPKVLLQSPIGKAIRYCLNHWSGLTQFLEDGRLEADNNLTEQQIKYLVMGRKNWMFSDTVAGANALAVHYGLMLSAKKHNLDPFKYYVAILKQIPHCASIDDFETLLPWNIRLS